MPANQFRNTTLALASLVTLALATGCQQAQRAEVGPLHAIWVTRYDYKTPTDIQQVMDNCAGAGFNAVMFQVRGNGTVSYDSNIEPWAEQYDFTDPGYDPLAIAVAEAHRRGLQLHAWVNVMPAWRGEQAPPVRNQLYNAHPEWFWYDQTGKRQPLVHRVGDRTRAWYASINPCLPEVRQYLCNVMGELVHKYDVDGLHMDYIRFPNEPVVPGERIPDYPRDQRTLALYRQATGKAPDDDPALWNKWRCDQVTQLVGDVHRTIRQARPGTVLTAAVSSDADRATRGYFQDARRWAALGIIDGLILMNYTDDLDTFQKRNRTWLERPINPEVPIYPGLTFRDAGTPRQSAINAQQQIAAAMQTAGGFCVFAYSHLFDPASGEFARRGGQASTDRQARRAVLIPYLRSISR